MRWLGWLCWMQLPALALSVSEAPAYRPDVQLPSLSLAEAIKMAHRDQPRLRVAAEQQRSAQAGLWNGASNLFPQINATLTYEKTTANFVPTPGTSPSAYNKPAQPNDASFNYIVSQLTITQLIYDFEQTYGRFKAAQAAVQIADFNRLVVKNSIDFNVRVGFANVVLQQALLMVQQTYLRNQMVHWQQTQAFLVQNTNSQLEVAVANSNLANAELQVVAAEGNFYVAQAQLHQSLGCELLPGSYHFPSEHLPWVEGEDWPVAQLIGEAMQQRPDLQVQKFNLVAQEQNLRAAYGGLGPTISGQFQVTDRGSAFSDLGWNWNLGVVASWPLFSGSSTYGGVAVAQAALRLAQAQLKNSVLQVAIDVITAKTNVTNAHRGIAAAETALVQINAQLALATQRLAQGLGSSVEVSDAQLALVNGQKTLKQYEYQLDTARASLLQALGRRG